MFLSFIIPCYNEGLKLHANIPKIYNYMFEHTTKDTTFEIIVVNDGSTDDTKEILQTQIKPITLTYRNDQFLDFTVISYDENQGKGYAVKKGLEKATGDYSIYMDADLSTDLSAIQTVLTKASQGYDFILGSRKLEDSNLPTKRSFIRTTISNTCKNIINKTVQLPNIKDTQCGFKALKQDFVKEIILPKQQINRFAFDVEYIYLASLYNKKMIEIPVIWTDDNDSRVTIIKSSIDFLKSLHQIKQNTSFYLSKD
ncbi:MAG: glycosyltransferase [Lachnospiraceae bacterium]|nr:glycosyltransferase [Lachnospiraceae bacterium]